MKQLHLHFIGWMIYLFPLIPQFCFDLTYFHSFSNILLEINFGRIDDLYIDKNKDQKCSIDHLCKLSVRVDRQKLKKMDKYELRKSTKLEVECRRNREITHWQIDSFKLVHVPIFGDPTIIYNLGDIFESKVLELIKNAESGDLFYFEEINVHNEQEVRDDLYLAIRVK